MQIFPPSPTCSVAQHDDETKIIIGRGYEDSTEEKEQKGFSLKQRARPRSLILALAVAAGSPILVTVFVEQIGIVSPV